MLRVKPILVSLNLVALVTLAIGCGGYKAANPDDLEPREGEIVGVLLDERGGAHPDAYIQLFEVNGTTPLQTNQGMDSDGRFGVFPPATGTYNIVGSFGEPGTSTQKAIKQGVSFTAGSAMNIGNVQGKDVALLTVQVDTPEGIKADDVLVEVLGYEATTTTNGEGLGIFKIGIPAGTYQVRFSKTGLSTLLKEVVLSAAEGKLMDHIAMTKS